MPGEKYFLGRDVIVDRLFLVTDEYQVLVENGRVAAITGPPFFDGK